MDNQENSNKKNLALKMLKIMGEVEYIKKTGFNQFHRYKYATESDVSSAMSSAMRNNNVFMFSSILSRECVQYRTRGDKDAFLVTVKIEVTFIDADSGESFTGTFYGDGTDSDDKAIYKATTGAQKYALMKTFLVETGDDPERDDIISKKKNESDKKQILELLETSAKNGVEALKNTWVSLSSHQQSIVVDDKERLKVLAQDSEHGD